MIKLEKDPGVRKSEAYFTTFERLMTAYKVKREWWAFKLAPQLVAKVQQAYATNYETLMTMTNSRRQSCIATTSMQRAKVNVSDQPPRIRVRLIESL